jgi:hypothetical protein
MKSKKSHNVFRILLGMFIGAFFFGTLVYATDSLTRTFETIGATALGSSASQVWFSSGWLSEDATTSGTTTYYNAWNDTQLIGNYLSGYYYDSNYGFFQLNWNTLHPENNVKIVATTDKCGEWVYGYRFDGYARGIETVPSGFNVWSIDFWYNDDVFVYYCDNDKKLHWYAYSEDLWTQTFEWIPFEIWTVPNIVNEFTPKVDPFFANNNSAVVADIIPNFNSIQWDKVSTEGWKESIFYIIK